MNWLRRLLGRARLEAELEKELRFHLEEQTDDLLASGRSLTEAQSQTKIKFGGPEQIKEQCRDARGTRWLEDLWQDIRYGLRTLRQKPGFTAVALATLALGIGATTVMFTIFDGVLLKPLPYPKPDRLVTVYGHTETWNVSIYGQQNLAYPDFLFCQKSSRSLDMAGVLYNSGSGTLSTTSEAEYVGEVQTTANLFSVLGLRLFKGRTFLPEEDRRGGNPVTVVSYTFWERHFTGSKNALGDSIILDDKSYTIVGVAPRGFRLDDQEPDVFTPIGQNTAPYMLRGGPHPVGVIARLRPGKTMVQAQMELTALGNRLAEQFPATNKGRSFEAQQLKPDAGDAGSTLWLLLGAAGLVLLIACVNVASLLLARAVSRERELAMRTALGAGRGRLIRQSLTESSVLSLAGGLLGILIAALGVRPFVVLWPGGLPRAEEVQLDWQVLLFAVGVSLLTGLLFGLIPALRVPSRQLEQALRAGSRTVGGSSRRLHSGFVVAAIALAVVLLVGAGTLGSTILRLSSLNPGFDVHNVLIARMSISPAALSNPARIRAAWQDVLDRARIVPGIRSIALVDTVPMREGNNQLGYSTTAAIPPENKQPFTLATSVTPDYLKVMKIPLLNGRFFDEHDRLSNELVVVVDEVMARQAFPGQDPVGRRLWIPDMGSTPLLIVGVVGHVRHWGLAGDDQAQVRAQVYYPFAQVPDRFLRRWSELMSLAVRTDVTPASVVPSLRKAVRGVSNDQVLYEVRTMEQLASDSLARQRFLLLLFGIFAGVALLLASIGIYGVLAYLIGQRVPEIGVRMALGATAQDVVVMVLRQSLVMICAGGGLGVLAAIAAGRVLERLVQGVQPAQASTYALTLSVLVTAAMLATFAPARRASRVDPVKALRQE
ncbi:MAG: ABC transporter permease [Bryobacteraceae bacterium]